MGVLLITPFPSVAQENKPPGRPIRIACVGDSITFGARVPERQRWTYPAVLGERYDVRHFGVSARTLLSAGDHPYVNEKAYRDLRPLFLNADGTPNGNMRGEHIHITSRGYEAWAKAIAPVVRAIMGGE